MKHRPTPHAHLHAPDRTSIRPGDRVRDLSLRALYLATPFESRHDWDGHAYPGAFYHGTVKTVDTHNAVVLFDDNLVNIIPLSDLERI